MRRVRGKRRRAMVATPAARSVAGLGLVGDSGSQSNGSKYVDGVSPVLFPPGLWIGLPLVADVPALVDLRPLWATDLSDKPARQWQRVQHFRTGPIEIVFVLLAVEFQRTIGAVLAVARDKVGVLGRLVLRRIQIADAPIDANPAQRTWVVDEFDLSANDLLSEKRTLLLLAAAKNFEVVVKCVVISVLAYLAASVSPLLGMARHGPCVTKD